MPSPALDELLAVMKRLRDPEQGCPWDIRQDFASIAPYTIEEAYEVADVIAREAWSELADELGDLLLQVVYHAQMAEERGWFAFEDVARAISAKMIRRHPHIFAEADGRDIEQQRRAWETIKAQERAARAGGRPSGLFDDVPRALPALTRSAKLQKRAEQPFDGAARAALRAAAENEAPDARQLGAALFALVALARQHKLDPEEALREANRRFVAAHGATDVNEQ